MSSVDLPNLKNLINQAIKEAQKASYYYKLAAVIFNKKAILSVGHNTAHRSIRNLHPKFQRYNSMCAEVAAIINARKNVRNTSLLVIRINKQNELRNSRPCERCQEYLKHVGIKKVYFIEDDKLEIMKF